VTLGYIRRDPPPGTWVLREKNDDGQYRREALGTADDVGFADGRKVLTYVQAREQARTEDPTLPTPRNRNR
jgi:hypothetical protein